MHKCDISLCMIPHKLPALTIGAYRSQVTSMRNGLHGLNKLDGFDGSANVYDSHDLDNSEEFDRLDTFEILHEHYRYQTACKTCYLLAQHIHERLRSCHKALPCIRLTHLARRSISPISKLYASISCIVKIPDSVGQRECKHPARKP